MKAVVAAFNQEKALVGAFSVITNLRMELFEALVDTGQSGQHCVPYGHLYSTRPLFDEAAQTLHLLDTLLAAQAKEAGPWLLMKYI